MQTIFLIAAALAALVHVYIFIIETFLWTRPSTRKTFGLSQHQAEATKEMAANQGVYNGALAVATVFGVVIYVLGYGVSGQAIIMVSVSIMAIAASYLFFSSKNKRMAAVKQFLFPFLTLIATLFI